MTPLSMWICLCIGAGIYHVTKMVLGFDPEWRSYFDAVYWVGVAMAVVHFGWVRT